MNKVGGGSTCIDEPLFRWWLSLSTSVILASCLTSHSTSAFANIIVLLVMQGCGRKKLNVDTVETSHKRHSINVSYSGDFLHLFLFILLVSMDADCGGARRGMRVGKKTVIRKRW